MAALFRARTLDPRVVPTGDVRIDRTHPLAQGLIGCYIPGSVAGLRDLCGNGPTLVANSAGNIVSTSAGPGLASLATDGGAISTTRPLGFERSSTNLAIMHFGYHTVTSATANDTILFGLYRTGGATPYYDGYAYNLSQSTSIGPHLSYAPNGSPGSAPTTGTAAVIGLNSLIAIFGTAGNQPISYWQNGALQTSLTGGQAGTHNTLTGAFTYYSDGLLAIGSYPIQNTRRTNAVHLAEMLWDTGGAQMSPDQAAWLSAEPFAMLRPVTRRSWFVPAAGALVGNPTGIARAPALGTITRTAGAVSVQPAGIARTPALGVVTRAATASGGHPLGIARTPALGVVTRTAGAVAIHPTGITHAPALGVATAAGGAPLVGHPAGIARTPAIGTIARRAGAVAIHPTGIAQLAVLGVATGAVGNPAAYPAGIARIPELGRITRTQSVPVGASPASVYSGSPFTDAEKADVRRFCGYPVYGAGASGFTSWRFFQAFGLLEYRMNGLAPAEVQNVRYYLATLYLREVEIQAASANLDTSKAAVWTRNPNEVRDRSALYDQTCRALCRLVGVPPGPGLESAGTMRLVV